MYRRLLPVLVAIVIVSCFVFYSTHSISVSRPHHHHHLQSLPRPPPRKPWRIFPVSREDYDHITGPEADTQDLFDEQNSVNGSENEVNDNGIDDSINNVEDRPPPLADIPKIPKKPAPPSQLSPVYRPAAELDAQFCPYGCRFLIPASIGEQESKAQKHLYQIGLLAVALNRTLVLPHLQRSRLGSCFDHPFDLYYDYAALDRLGIPSITLNDFKKYASARDVPLDSQLVSILKPNKGSSGSLRGLNHTAPPNKFASEIPHCLDNELDFTPWSPFRIFAPIGWHRTSEGQEEYGTSVVQSLSTPNNGNRSTTTTSDMMPSVLVVEYKLLYDLLTPKNLRTLNPELPFHIAPYDHFAYAPTLSALARHAASLLSPFVAVHWRQETIAAESISPCAIGLVDHLIRISKRHPSLRSVYLATDYPLESIDGSANAKDDSPFALAHSGTFRTFTNQHHQAMRMLVDSFLSEQQEQQQSNPQQEQSLEYIKPTKLINMELITYPRLVASGLLQSSLPPELAAAFPPELGGIDLASVDPGLLAIIDKEIAVYANLFVVGNTRSGKTACAKRSSFTNQIITERKEVQSHEELFIKSPQIWSRVGEEE